MITEISSIDELSAHKELGTGVASRQINGVKYYACDYGGVKGSHAALYYFNIPMLKKYELPNVNSVSFNVEFPLDLLVEYKNGKCIRINLENVNEFIYNPTINDYTRYFIDEVTKYANI